LGDVSLFTSCRLLGSWDCKTAFPDNEDFAGKAWETIKRAKRVERPERGVPQSLGERIGDELLVETASAFDDLLTTRIFLIQSRHEASRSNGIFL
jgi:hypothetical protein